MITNYGCRTRPSADPKRTLLPLIGAADDNRSTGEQSPDHACMPARMWAAPALMMPGAPVADTVLADVRAARTGALVAAGHVPGLATLLVGDDPASAGYMRMKQEKAAELGFSSPHLHLPSRDGALPLEPPRAGAG